MEGAISAADRWIRTRGVYFDIKTELQPLFFWNFILISNRCWNLQKFQIANIANPQKRPNWNLQWKSIATLQIANIANFQRGPNWNLKWAQNCNYCNHFKLQILQILEDANWRLLVFFLNTIINKHKLTLVDYDYRVL